MTEPTTDPHPASVPPIDHSSAAATFGLERLGIYGLSHSGLAMILIAVLSCFAALGITRLKVDDSLSELFRTNTPEFRQYEAIDRRFPSSEFDVLVVAESQNLLTRQGLEAFRRAMVDVQLVDGTGIALSMLSARGSPDATGYAPPVVPDDLPTDPAALAKIVEALRKNEIVDGKFLSKDGTLAMAVVPLDRRTVTERGAKDIIGQLRKTLEAELHPAGIKVELTGAPVMQMEIRNAVERDQLTYNGLGLLFGAAIALVFFRSIGLMLLAALPPILAVLWSLGMLGWMNFKLNLFLNVMTPLVMVMGFADSMQMVCALRDRLRAGDTKEEALDYMTRVVGPGCVLAHGTALLSFLALLLSDSALIRTFGMAGALAVCVSYVAVVGVLPLLGRWLIRDAAAFAPSRNSSDHAMDALGRFVGTIVDRVVKTPLQVSAIGLALIVMFSAAHISLVPKYRLADQVPDREQALSATSRLDQKLTGANPVHVMIEWQGERKLFSAPTLDLIGAVHAVIEREAGLGNTWSLESLRRWLKEAGDERIETVEKYVGLLPDHLVQRFVEKGGQAVLVTGRLPDIDASQILPVVEKLDRALNPIRQANPGVTISVTGLPAIAARNSASLIKQLNEALGLAVLLVAVLIGLAFRKLFSGAISVLPGLFPVVASGTVLALWGRGLEFSSVIALIVIFGLSADGLIHFLNRLHREERVGEPAGEAIKRARVLVGPAIILTTIVLAFGLGVTVFSDLPSLRMFGAVCGITLLASLIGDLVFLPANVALWRKIWPLGGQQP